MMPAAETQQDDNGIFGSVELVERLQLFATYLSCTFALVIGFSWLERFGYIIAFSTGVLCLVGLLSSLFLKILIGDFYRQFQYREKFFLFLIHVAAMVCPYFFLRLHVFGKPAAFIIMFSILLVMLCFQSVDKFFRGRIYAAQFVMVTIAALYFRNSVSGVLIYTWFALFLFSIRYAHLAQRLEDFGDATGIELWPALRRGVLPIVFIALFGALCGWASMNYLPKFHFNFQAPQIDNTQRPFERLSDGQIIFRFFMLLALIGAILILLKWIDSKLLRRKGAPIIAEGDGVITAKAYHAADISGDPLAMEQVSGARERILTAFRQFNERLQRIDLGRKEDETVPAYFLRLDRTVRELQTLQFAGSTAFDQACYGETEPTMEEAEQFVQLLNEKIRSLKSTQ